RRRYGLRRHGGEAPGGASLTTRPGGDDLRSPLGPANGYAGWHGRAPAGAPYRTGAGSGADGERGAEGLGGLAGRGDDLRAEGLQVLAGGVEGEGGDGDAADDAAGVVEHGGGHAAHAGLVLLVVDGVAAVADAGQMSEQVLVAGDGVGGARLQAGAGRDP